LCSIPDWEEAKLYPFLAGICYALARSGGTALAGRCFFRNIAATRRALPFGLLIYYPR
jgi:hypothetical protein